MIDPKGKKPAAGGVKGKDAKAKDTKKVNTASITNLEPEQGKTPPVASYKNPLTKSAWQEASSTIDTISQAFTQGIESTKVEGDAFKDNEYKHRFVWQQTAGKIMADADD